MTEETIREAVAAVLHRMKQLRTYDTWRQAGITSLHDLRQHIQSEHPNAAENIIQIHFETAKKTAHVGADLRMQYPDTTLRAIMRHELGAVMYTRNGVRWAVLVLARKHEIAHLYAPDDVSRCIRVFLRSVWDRAVSVPDSLLVHDPYKTLRAIRPDGSLESDGIDKIDKIPF